MSVRVNTNIEAFDAQRNLSLVSSDFSKAVQQLSSGLRINSAADDAAGLAISEKLQSQIQGFDQGARNAQDAISMVQTGESALGTVQDVLQRMRQLAVQASNDTYTDSDRSNIQTEINQLVAEVDRISNQTDFNTKKLLDGSAGGAIVSGGGPDVKGIVAMAGVALSTTFSITAATSATRSAVEGASAQGSFFTQTSTMTIQGGLGTQTFTAQKGESLETFFQVVNSSGIGVTMQVDSSSGVVEIVNNNFGVNTAVTNASGTVLTGASIPGDKGVTVNGTHFASSNTVFTGGPAAVSVTQATGDFASTGLSMKLDTTDEKGGSVGSDGKFVSGSSGLGGWTSATATSNASITLSFLGGTQILTASGINSDTITGASTSAGIILTLTTPGLLTASGGDVFSVSDNKGAALQFQVGANQGQSIALAINAVNSDTLGITSLDVLTQPDAETAITQLDRAIQTVSAARSNLGAAINRLTNAVNNDQTAQENALSAQSRIRDVNVAAETVQFTRDQILMQSGTAVLAQANQAPANLLTLLR